MRDKLAKLSPHLCICEWDKDADTETVLQDIILAGRYNLRSLSVSPNLLSIARSLAPANLKIFTPERFVILKDTEHTDMMEIVPTDISGTMFIDNKGKFLHRFYDFLSLINPALSCQTNYCAGTDNIQALEDARRLTEKVRPLLLAELSIFVTSGFFRSLDIREKSI